MKGLKFYQCKKCGKIVMILKDCPCPTICCGEEMQELVPGTTDAAVEKHVPVYETEGNKVSVKVGSVDHPMLPEHFIDWVAIETEKGSQMCYLEAGNAPSAEFALADGDKLKGVYAHCNLHGLWKA